MATGYYSFYVIDAAYVEFQIDGYWTSTGGQGYDPLAYGSVRITDFSKFQEVKVVDPEAGSGFDAHRLDVYGENGVYNGDPEYDQKIFASFDGHSAGSDIYLENRWEVRDDLGHPSTNDGAGPVIEELSIGGRTYYTIYNQGEGGENDVKIEESTEYGVSEYFSPNLEQNTDFVVPNYTGLYQATAHTIDTICFTIGTLIETSDGNKPVEELTVGDMIATMDDGYQPIRWIGSTIRDAIDLARNPKLHPICIPAGALGSGLPKRDLMVSRQHRVLVRSKIAQRMFDAEEILIPAIKLVGLNGIEISGDVDNVTYFHILFDKHQVIFSEDAPTESLFTGPEALKSVTPEARQEIETLFPEITEPNFIPEPARLIPGNGKQIKQLVERHGKHGTPLLNG